MKTLHGGNDKNKTLPYTNKACFTVLLACLNVLIFTEFNLNSNSSRNSVLLPVALILRLKSHKGHETSF